MKGLVVLLVALTVSSCGNSNDPKAVAKDFLLALASQDFEKAKELGTERTSGMITLIESMAKMAKENGQKLDETKLPEVEIGECEIDGDKAVCYYTSEGKEEKINLVKVEGKWKVDMSKEQQ